MFMNELRKRRDGDDDVIEKYRRGLSDRFVCVHKKRILFIEIYIRV